MFPKVDPVRLCDSFKLCWVRKDKNNNDLMAIKYLSWDQQEVLVKEYIWLDTFEQKNIVRSYSSWHVFLDSKRSSVFLVEVDKNWTHHFQFTWWSPKEEEVENAIITFGGIQTFDLSMVLSNAQTRTQKRTSVSVTKVVDTIPKVDRVLIEKKDPVSQENYRNLVCLMHFLVDSYEWELVPIIWVEWVIWWEWIPLEDLQKRDDIAPNVSIIVLDFINQKQ